MENTEVVQLIIVILENENNENTKHFFYSFIYSFSFHGLTVDREQIVLSQTETELKYKILAEIQNISLKIKFLEP